jgi:hypothetical protein
VVVLLGVVVVELVLLGAGAGTVGVALSCLQADRTNTEANIKAKTFFINSLSFLNFAALGAREQTGSMPLTADRFA